MASWGVYSAVYGKRTFRIVLGYVDVRLKVWIVAVLSVLWFFCDSTSIKSLCSFEYPHSIWVNIQEQYTKNYILSVNLEVFILHSFYSISLC